MFAKGARVALRSFVSKDPLKGTEHLLTAAGRATLTAHYAERSGGGAAAVATACDVSPSHLDAAAFFEDYDRHARPRGTSRIDGAPGASADSSACPFSGLTTGRAAGRAPGASRTRAPGAGRTSRRAGRARRERLRRRRGRDG